MVQSVLFILFFFLGLFLTPLNNLFIKTVIFLPMIIFLLGSIKKHIGTYRAGFPVGSVCIAVSVLAGQYLKEYLSFAGVLMYVIGVVFSLIAIIGNILFVFATSKKVKEEIIEVKKQPVSLKDKLNKMKLKINELKKLISLTRKYKRQGNLLFLSFQMAYVELEERKQPAEKNAMDFTFLKEVEYERNKYNVD